MPPVALLKSSAQETSPRRISARDLAPLHMTTDEYKVLRIVCFRPAITINMLKRRLPEVESVSLTVRSLTEQSLLYRYRTVYNLTFLGWMMFDAATKLINSLGP